MSALGAMKHTTHSVWGGCHLRARWYHPDLAAFLSRDPMHNLNRYGYGGGNPVMHTDPSGMSFLKALGRDIVKGAAKLSAILNKGWYGHLDRFFLAPLMAPLQVLANPRAFWRAIKADKDGIDIFNLEADEVRGISQALRNNVDEDDDVVVRRRRVPTKALGVPLPKNVGPLQENAALGLYHEQLIAITRDHIFTSEVLGGEVVTQTLTHDTQNLESILGGASGKDFALAGRIDGLERATLSVDGFEGFNPLNLRSSCNPEGAGRYSYFRNNSAALTKAILRNLEMW